MIFFFFSSRRRHTRFDCDWSSDVCSSDLINLEIAKGEIVFVCGASGAGKSTLLKLLFRQEDPTEGQILIDGRSVTRLGSRGVAQLRRKIGLVFQEFRLLPGLTVLDNVALAAQVVGKSKRE